MTIWPCFICRSTEHTCGHREMELLMHARKMQVREMPESERRPRVEARTVRAVMPIRVIEREAKHG